MSIFKKKDQSLSDQIKKNKIDKDRIRNAKAQAKVDRKISQTRTREKNGGAMVQLKFADAAPKEKTYKKGDRITASYNTSVYKPNLNGWRSESVDATLEAISPKKFKVVNAKVEPAGSKRQQFSTTGIENREMGKTKFLSSLYNVKTVKKAPAKKAAAKKK